MSARPTRPLLDEFPRRTGSALTVHPDCGMRSPMRPDGRCVLCDLLGIEPKQPRGVRGGKRGRRRGHE